MHKLLGYTVPTDAQHAHLTVPRDCMLHKDRYYLALALGNINMNDIVLPKKI